MDKIYLLTCVYNVIIVIITLLSLFKLITKTQQIMLGVILIAMQIATMIAFF